MFFLQIMQNKREKGQSSVVISIVNSIAQRLPSAKSSALRPEISFLETNDFLSVRPSGCLQPDQGRSVAVEQGNFLLRYCDSLPMSRCEPTEITL